MLVLPSAVVVGRKGPFVPAATEKSPSFDAVAITVSHNCARINVFNFYMFRFLKIIYTCAWLNIWQAFFLFPEGVGDSPELISGNVFFP